MAIETYVIPACPVCGKVCSLIRRLAPLKYTDKELNRLIKQFHAPVCRRCRSILEGDKQDKCPECDRDKHTPRKRR